MNQWRLNGQLLGLSRITRRGTSPKAAEEHNKQRGVGRNDPSSWGIGYTDGVGQAKDYARRLKARFAFSTNGIGWYGNDWRDRFGAVPFETGGGKREPRYYQHNAITAVL